ARLLDQAERPVILVGGQGWQGSDSLDALAAWAEAAAIPIAASFRNQDLVDNGAPAYVGDAGVGMPPHIREMLSEADVILGLNIHFDEMLTDGYTLFEAPVPRQKLIHVHASDRELGKVYQPTLPVQAAPDTFAEALAQQNAAGGNARRARLVDLRTAYDASFDLPPQPGDVDMGAVMAEIRAQAPDDAILTNGAGNFAIWPGRLFRYGKDHRLLGPQSGAMGAGIPAAVAAKIAHPERVALCFAGDGDFQMTCQELGTAMQFGAQPIVLIVNNGTYGTIRMHQEREYPNRISGTDLKNPDFVKIGEAYGMLSREITRTADFAPAFAEALASPTGALLDLHVSPEAITPRRTLSQIRGG
ncbi:MAG: thiamine pyrophosphate-dependent enzyme, partial [Pseudomonadota bacterium]